MPALCGRAKPARPWQLMLVANALALLLHQTSGHTLPLPQAAALYLASNNKDSIGLPHARNPLSPDAPAAGLPSASEASSWAAGSMSCTRGCPGGLTALTLASFRSGIRPTTCAMPMLDYFIRQQRVLHMHCLNMVPAGGAVYSPVDPPLPFTHDHAHYSGAPTPAAPQHEHVRRTHHSSPAFHTTYFESPDSQDHAARPGALAPAAGARIAGLPRAHRAAARGPPATWPPAVYLAVSSGQGPGVGHRRHLKEDDSKAAPQLTDGNGCLHWWRSPSRQSGGCALKSTCWTVLAVHIQGSSCVHTDGPQHSC